MRTALLTVLLSLVVAWDFPAFGQWSSWTSPAGSTYYTNSFSGATGSSWTPSGGGTTFFNFGGTTGSSWTPPGGSTTFFSGDLFRGEKTKSVLFDDDVIAARIPDWAWIDVVETRNIPGMMQVAWGLRMAETALAKADKKTTSAMMFATAAEVAVAQLNENALKEIVALEPSCQKYQEELKITLGKSRGANTSMPYAMPRLVPFYYEPVGSGAPSFLLLDKETQGKVVKELAEREKALQPWETPILSPSLIQMKFRGAAAHQATEIAFLANMGRAHCQPELLAQAGLLVAQQGDPKSMPGYLNPARMLEEAAELAVATGNRNSLSLVVDIMKNSQPGLASQDQVASYAEELKVLGQTRGGEPSLLERLVLRPLSQ